MPAQALPLKKYRSGTSPVSKMSDNEDAPPPLWYSGKLSVQHPVGPPVPELPQRPEEGTKVPSLSAATDAIDVLPYHPAGAYLVNKSKKDEGQVSTGVGHALAESGDGE